MSMGASAVVVKYVNPYPIPTLEEQIASIEEDERETLYICPNAWALWHRFVNRETGETIRARCDSWRCLYCGPRKVDQWRQLVRAAEPVLFVTLTKVGWTVEEASRVLTTVMQRLRRGYRSKDPERKGYRASYQIEYFAVLERHADFEENGFHWHLLVKGVDFLPNDLVSDALRSATKGRSYITKVERIRNARAIGYVTKYLTKQITNEEKGVRVQEKEMIVLGMDDSGERTTVVRSDEDGKTIEEQRPYLYKEYLDKKGWKLARWYEEPEQSAKYDSIDDRPVFAQLLSEAGTRFQVVVCAFSNRWARSMEAGYASLSRLRRARVWWATADDRWDIDRVQQDGFDVAFAVDMQMNASYVRQLSKRTIAGKEDRARDGYHNGSVPFGYLPPEYPKAPDGAPSTWRPPRTPIRPDPVTFPALVRIGELAAQGWTDRAIANELEGYVSRTARFGERQLTKDTIVAIRRSWLPRESAPGSGRGTIDTPAGELVEGKHQAAWPYELWQRMVEVKDSQFRRPTKDAQKRPHEFSRIIVCATCMRPLRVTFGNVNKNYLPYYRDMSVERKLPCSVAEAGYYSVRSSLVVMQFGEIVRSFELPLTWREAIVERCQTANNGQDAEQERLRRRRVDLDAEQKRLITAYTKGYITEQTIDEEMERIRTERFSLPLPIEQDAQKITQEALSSGETLERVADYWSEALPEERRDMVWSLLVADGLIYDLERHVIVGLKPRAGVLPAFALGLEATSMWEQRDGGLWFREDYWPPKLNKTGLLPSHPPSLTPAQQEQVIMLIRQGMSLRKIAELLGTSHESVHRLVVREGIDLRPSVQRLTPAQKQEALVLLSTGVSVRKVAEQFEVNHESLRRFAREEGVILKPWGQRQTPTEAKLTALQKEEVLALLNSGTSFREVARRFDMNRESRRRLVQHWNEKE